MQTDDRPHTRWPLPTRSRTDRKLGGVAGGLGRAWNIDPILIRVAFVVLALFGGTGVLLYCAGWLAMRGEDEDVSAIEALLGRGKSSVSPALALLLIIVGLGSVGSVFALFSGYHGGFPFWPGLPIVIVLAVVLHRRRRFADHDPHRSDRGAPGAGGPCGDWANDLGTRMSQWGRDVGDRAGSWFDGDWPKRAWPPSGPGDSATQRDGAERESAPAGDGVPASPGDGRQAGAGNGTQTNAGDTTTMGPSAGGDTPPSPEDLLRSDRVPPAWDPLGAAPFAWDLPEPSPLPGTSDAATDARGPHSVRTRGSVLGRIFLGLALIAGSITGAGVAAQWWDLTWSAVTGIALGVLAVGLAITALRGRGSRALVGPGIFLAVLTLALSVSGLKGTGGFGGQGWVPTSVSDVAAAYTWNAGDATLDLSSIKIPKGETVHTSVTIGGGQVSVIVPPDATVTARCSATVGQIQCLDHMSSGVRPSALAEQAGDGHHGTIDITVHSNAGKVVLTNDTNDLLTKPGLVVRAPHAK